MSSNAHDDVMTSDRPGNRHELVLSRRSSDAIRARAAELSTTPGRLLERVVKAGLEQLANMRPTYGKNGHLGHLRTDDREEQ